MALTETDAPDEARNATGSRRVRIWLAFAAACLATFIAFGLTYQRWEPWLVERLGEDSWITSVAFEIVGALLIVVPLMGLMRAISALGRDSGTIDGQGRVTLRIRDGARRMHLGLCAGLFVLFASGAYVLQDDTLTLRLACVVSATLSVLGGYIIWTSRLVYDDQKLLTPRFARRPRQFHWQDLRDVCWVEDLDHFRLDFTKGRKTTISSTYAGATELIALAKRKLARNAGTARS